MPNILLPETMTPMQSMWQVLTFEISVSSSWWDMMFSYQMRTHNCFYLSDEYLEWVFILQCWLDDVHVSLEITWIGNRYLQCIDRRNVLYFQYWMELLTPSYIIGTCSFSPVSGSWYSAFWEGICTNWWTDCTGPVISLPSEFHISLIICNERILFTINRVVN